MRADTIEYRNGNDKENSPQKITGLDTRERCHARWNDR